MTTLAELKARIEAEALRREAARDGFTMDAVKAFLGQGIALPPELARERTPPPDPLHFRWFESLHGRDFVESAYTVLLGRGPDAAGMKHYLELLGRGEDKAFIAGAIAFSPEGRQRNVRVGGLMPRFAVSAAKRVPIVGPVVAWAAALATVHLRRRDAQAFEEQVHARLDAIGGYVGQSGAQVAMRIDALLAVMESRED